MKKVLEIDEKLAGAFTHLGSMFLDALSNLSGMLTPIKMKAVVIMIPVGSGLGDKFDKTSIQLMSSFPKEYIPELFRELANRAEEELKSLADTGESGFEDIEPRAPVIFPTSDEQPN